MKTRYGSCYFYYAAADKGVVSPYLDIASSAGIRIFHPSNDVKDLKRADKIVLFISDRSNMDHLKRIVNYSLDRKKDLVCIFLDSIALDHGLQVQLGLAIIFDNATLLLSDFLTALEMPPRKIPWIIGIIPIIVLSVLAFIIFRDRQAVILVEDSSVIFESNLSGALRNAGVDSNNDGLISKEEAAVISQLDLSGSELYDLKNISIFVSLTDLNLSNNNLADITELAYLTELVSLDISNNQVTEVTPLLACSKLEKLNVSNNPVTDIQNLTYHPANPTVIQ